jgi:hypothetical protein
VEGCSFVENEASYGGGLKNEGAAAVLSNCTFVHNAATGRGGGLDSGAGSTLDVVNCTFFENENGGIGNPDSQTVVVNTIIASNSDGNCQGWEFLDGSNNLDTDGTCYPGFTETTAEELALSWQGWTFTLGPASVAVDAGDDGACPADDQLGQLRPQDGDGDGEAVCDVGATELPGLMDLPPALWLPLVRGLETGGQGLARDP